MLFISLLSIALFLFIQPSVEVLWMFSSKPFKYILTVLYRVTFLPQTVTTVISLTGFNAHEYRHYQEQNGTTDRTKEPKHPPLDAFEREYREQTGRAEILLAKKADEVVRVICGIGQKIK